MDEENEKSSKLLGVFIIIVVILFIFIFVYKGITNPRKKNKEESNEETPTEKPVEVLKWDKLEEFPKNDDDVKTVLLRYQSMEGDICDYDTCDDIYIYDNVKDYKVLDNSMDIVFNCTNSIKKDDCGNISFTIDNKINYKNAEFDIESKANSHLILKTTNNYIIKEIGNEYGEGNIYIYDKNGNLLNTIKNTVTKFNKIIDKEIEYEITFEYNPTINSNYLYYIERGEEVNFNSGLDSEISFNRINLSSNELKPENFYNLKAITYELP